MVDRVFAGICDKLSVFRATARILRVRLTRTYPAHPLQLESAGTPPTRVFSQQIILPHASPLHPLITHAPYEQNLTNTE